MGPGNRSSSFARAPLPPHPPERPSLRGECHFGGDQVQPKGRAGRSAVSDRSDQQTPATKCVLRNSRGCGRCRLRPRRPGGSLTAKALLRSRELPLFGGLTPLRVFLTEHLMRFRRAGLPHHGVTTLVEFECAAKDSQMVEPALGWCLVVEEGWSHEIAHCDRADRRSKTRPDHTSPEPTVGCRCQGPRHRRRHQQPLHNTRG